MRGLSLSYDAIAQKFARAGGTFDAKLARLIAVFHSIDIRCASNIARSDTRRSYDPSLGARIAPDACGPCLLSFSFGDAARFAPPFAETVRVCGFYFSRTAFFGRVKVSATQQRAVKSCANHFLHSPSSQSQPLPVVWTTTQNAPSRVALLAHLLRMRQVAVRRLARLAALLLAHCVTTQAFVAKKQSTDLALSALFGGLGRNEKQGFRAGQLGSLFSCA